MSHSGQVFKYLCKHVGIRANLNQARNQDLCNHDLGFQYQALTRLRYQWFGNHLDDEPQIGTLIRRSLVNKTHLK